MSDNKSQIWSLERKKERPKHINNNFFDDDESVAASEI